MEAEDRFKIFTMKDAFEAGYLRDDYEDVEEIGEDGDWRYVLIDTLEGRQVYIDGYGDSPEDMFLNRALWPLVCELNKLAEQVPYV